MAHSMDVLLNDFATRSFRETADKEYIVARMAFRARLMQPFLWSSLHCLEKYVKGICLFNRIEANHGYTVLDGIERINSSGKFSIDLSLGAKKFIEALEEQGAKYRYYETSYFAEDLDFIRLDCAVSEIRRYCKPINSVDIHVMQAELNRIRTAKEINRKETCIVGGFLEKIVDDKNHPAREALIWKNLYFGPSRRKSIKIRPYMEAGNSPFFLSPEIIDEVEKYVFIPKDIKDGVRQYLAKKSKETSS